MKHIIRLETGMKLYEDVDKYRFIRPVTPAFAAWLDMPKRLPDGELVVTRWESHGVNDDGVQLGRFVLEEIDRQTKQERENNERSLGISTEATLSPNERMAE